ncbi:MAG: NAD(P)-binding domain-containing protein, partial [Burkholderiaceae bacterium]
MNIKTIAVLGTGLMGAPMAKRLLNAGLGVHVWNRSPDKAQALDAFGATVAATAAQAAAQADVVITMLQDGDAVGDVLFTQGAAKAMQTHAVVVDMSSIAPAQAQAHARQLANLGLKHIDAPVSGGTVGAEQGLLAIMAGG